MKLRYFAFLLLFSSIGLHCNSQAGTWTWVNGNDSTRSHPFFGTQGIPGVNNTPGGLYEACSWIDKQGNFWIFGGSDTAFAFHETNDLWKYDPVNNTWTWISGPGGICEQPGVYGVKGVPSPNNHPGARSWGTLSWTDENGDLWLFGGEGMDSTTSDYGFLNDLWRYNIASAEWTWMSGSGRCSETDVYGTQGQPSDLNTPGAREESNCSWEDKNNNLWLFGGFGLTSLFYNDLWSYSVATNQWTWVKGPEGTGNPGNYGRYGIEADSNLPPSRGAYTRWQDADGNLYVWGGIKDLFLNQSSEYSDVWKYNPVNNNWTWIAGDSGTGYTGNYQSYCYNNDSTGPMSRADNRTAQILGCVDQFYAFGGYHSDTSYDDYMVTLNDLWVFSTGSNSWKWVSGTGNYNDPGSYGAPGVPSSTHFPPSRMGPCLWLDNQGTLWLYGGQGADGYNYDDVWKFVPDVSSCIGLPIVYTGISYALSDSNICRGDSASLTLYQASDVSISPSESVYWIDSLHGRLHPDTTTTYSLFALSGCNNNDSTIASLTIHVSAPAPVIAGDSTLVCAGDSVQLCATSAFAAYLWSNNQTTRCFSTNLAGTYNLTVTDNNHCTAVSNSIQINVHALIPVSISVKGDTLKVYSGYTYQWFLNGHTVPGANSNIYIAETNGDYSVAVTDSFGCVATSGAFLYSGIGSIDADNISIYPNPSSGNSWQIAVSSGLIGSDLELTDADGRLVYTMKITKERTQLELTLASGVYMLRVYLNGNSFIRKLVKL